MRIALTRGRSRNVLRSLHKDNMNMIVDGVSPLAFFLLRNSPDGVSACLSMGVDVLKRVDRLNGAPLEYVASNRDFKMMNVLLSKGVPFNAESYGGVSPLEKMVSESVVFNMLMELGAKSFLENAKTTEQGELSFLEKLLDQAFVFDRKSSSGIPSYVGSPMGTLSWKALLSSSLMMDDVRSRQKGSTVELKDVERVFASLNGLPESESSKCGLTATTIMTGNVFMVERLLNLGADASVEVNGIYPPHFLAFIHEEEKRGEMLDFLSSKGVNCLSCSPSGKSLSSLFHDAAEKAAFWGERDAYISKMHGWFSAQESSALRKRVASKPSRKTNGL